MVNVTGLAIRGGQFFLTVLTLSLSGALVAQQLVGGSPSQVNFALFASIFSFLTGFYTLFSVFSDAAHVLVLFILDGFNTLFTFAAGTALAVRLGIHSCGNMPYVTSNPITNGSLDPSARCHEAQALTAFTWFLFAAYVASTIFSFLDWRGGSSPMSRSHV
ncbi:hypothetical protein ABW20_dc0107159 [Dactylellina cionopaga]|nr:hypothetical protein ABW20_dc0107159 [Dactylellina cionopaga]